MLIYVGIVSDVFYIKYIRIAYVLYWRFFFMKPSTYETDC